MDIGLLVAALMMKTNSAVFTAKELERAAAAEPGRLARRGAALARALRRLAGKRRGEQTLASHVPAE